jgi:transketolase
MLLYSLLHLTGYEDMTLEQVKNFRQLGRDHRRPPEYGHAKGIETTTGPLGQGSPTPWASPWPRRCLRAKWGRRSSITAPG